MKYVKYFISRRRKRNKLRTSHGNSNLSKYAKKGITLIGDGAAIGPYMYDLMLSKAELFLPECFEWLLLHSPVFAENKEVQEQLAHTSQACRSFPVFHRR